MPEYLITHCTVADAPALARNNMHAFWQDPNWRMLWRRAAGGLPFVVAQAAARMPRNLLPPPGGGDDGGLRHYRAVDAATGRTVGYVRWRLPAGRRRDGGNGGGGPAWADGVTPDVGPEERAALHRRAEDAWWETDPSSDVLDGPMVRIRSDLLARKEYIELDYLAVHPENQGKGVATALLRHGIQKAEELGVDIFVLAFVAAFGLYKRMGFKLLDSLVQDATPYGGNDYYAVQYLEFEVNKQK